ncbi:MAG TPA: vWA domain-containing protein [Bacteroidales bacterium]|nr:vWA domain-containing protein [Bacteroidales bacterium]
MKRVVMHDCVLRGFITALVILCVCIPAQSQTQPPKYQPPETRILFIFDASQSMAGTWQKETKISIARNVLIHIIDSLEQLSNVKMALRIYGHQSPVPPQNCNDTKLEVPFASDNAPLIRQKLRFLVPKGTTPIAYSLQMGGSDFPPDVENCRNIIILITDGVEACDGDACQVSQDLQKQGIILKPFVIGIGIDENFEQTFNCIGNYYNAQYEEKLKEVMKVVISQALDATTAQINLLDSDGNPTETNVNCTFYDNNSGKIYYNYIHTLNHRGLPDTLTLDQLPTYHMRVHTLPPVDVYNIRLVPGKHTIIAADVPQGTLLLKTPDAVQYRGLEFIVRKAGDMNTLNMQKMYSEEKYIVGKYDLEIPVLPRIYLKDVDIKQSHTTTVEIQRPGLVTFLRSAVGFGSVYLRKSTTEEEWVYNLDNTVKNETLQLQPAKYRVVFRALNAKQTLYTVSKTFEVRSGSTEVVQLY